MNSQMVIGEMLAENSKSRSDLSLLSKSILAKFNATFLNEVACREAILNMLHFGKRVCPYCNQQIQGKLLVSFVNFKRVQCPECNKFFTALTGTFLAGTRLSFSQLMLLIVLINADIPVSKIECITKIHRETIVLFEKKLNKRKRMYH
jgi:transposase-like protein